MDMSSSRKRARETESEDEEPTGRRKQPSSSPPSLEQHTAASCHVQQPDHGSAISPQSGETAATSSPPAAQDGGPPGRASTTSRHPAESTAAASAAPQSKGAPGTILNAPSAPDGGASTAASASEPATNESAADEMELTDATPTVSSHQGPDHPAARFLKDPPCQPASRPKPKGQKKKQKKRKEPAHDSRSSPGATDDSRRPPATLVTPSVPTAAVQRVTPSARESTTYDFTLVQSKRDRRRARALETAALPVDPAVVGTRNIVAADTTTRECLEELLAVTELHGIPVTARLPAERGKSTGFLHGVVGLPADTDLLGAIESSVPVLSATREESTITIRFAGPVPPEHVRLFKLGFRVPRHPALSIAVATGLSTEQLAELFADAFAPPPPSVRPVSAPCELPPHNKAELLAPLRYFPTRAILEHVEVLCSAEFTLSELRIVLTTRKRRSAPGADGLTHQVLRNIDAAQLPSLLEAFNGVWRSGIIPADWKEAIVVPILKRGKAAKSVSSYRPVSLTSVAGKTLEAMALRRLEWIASALDAFAPEQSGFRRLHSAADSLADVVATLEHAASRQEAGYLVLLDVQRAFDGLPHITIIQALRELRVTGRLFDYIAAFLSDRTLRVRVGDTLSAPRSVTSGVPQGSVISPFLFNLALARLPDYIPKMTAHEVRVAIYADDIALFACGPTALGFQVRESLQSAINAVDEYLASIGLQLSASKTEAFTPSEDRATRYGAISKLCIGDREFQVNAYQAAPENTSKGLIRNIAKTESSADVIANLVTQRNPGVLHAKRMGNTDNTIILFDECHSGREAHRWRAVVPVRASQLSATSINKVNSSSRGSSNKVTGALGNR
nr:uncharacterized protein LOC126518151 [Dermacentor andersoni]